MSEARKTLGDIAVGESAVVRKVGCARATAVRLMEMGLLPGTRVTLRRIAPLGDPLELSVNGYALSIRRNEAALVAIDPPTASDALAASAPLPREDDGVEVT